MLDRPELRLSLKEEAGDIPCRGTKHTLRREERDRVKYVPVYPSQGREYLGSKVINKRSSVAGVRAAESAGEFEGQISFKSVQRRVLE